MNFSKLCFKTCCCLELLSEDTNLNLHMSAEVTASLMKLQNYLMMNVHHPSSSNSNYMLLGINFLGGFNLTVLEHGVL